MKLLVAGAAGDLGRAFLDAVPAHHDVEAFDHEALDVGDYDAVMQTVTAVAPEAVVNCAAFTDVDGNERDRLRAARNNARGPANLAIAARLCDAVLLHVSTDYVFDGEKGEPYDEMDEPNPLSAYGRAKLAGERAVRELMPASFVVRTSYVFGGGRDYLTGAVRDLAAGKPAGGIADRTGSPTLAGHLAARLLPLLLTMQFGTYHLAGSEPATWFDVLMRIRESGGLPGEVLAQRGDEIGLIAPRPVYSALTSVLLPSMSVEPMPSLDEAVADFLSEAL